MKEKYYDPIEPRTVKKALSNVRELLLRKNLSSFRISRSDDFSDKLEPGLYTEIIHHMFKDTPIQVTICHGKVEFPDKEQRTKIITTLHDSLVGEHKGINQTYQKIRERYYWPGMRNDILDYIRKCPECCQKKIGRFKTRQLMIITDTPIELFDKVSIDTVGKLRNTPHGNCHILTIQCNLTKCLIAVPIRDF